MDSFAEYYILDDTIPNSSKLGTRFGATLKKDREIDGEVIKKGTKVVAHQIEKKSMTQKQSKALQSSFSTLRKLKGHINVKQLIEVFEDDTHIVIIKESTGGVSLLNLIDQSGPCAEREAAAIVMQVMSVIDYMNTEGLSHRGLSMEGIWVTDKMAGGINTIKVSEFQASGPVADSLDVGCFLLTANAAPHCVAPEVLSAEVPFSIKVDWWSIGVITYTLLYGVYPFDDPNDAVVIQNILDAKYTFPDNEIKISNEAKDFIRSLLQIHVPSRASGEQCWEHIWLNSLFPE